MTQDRQEAIEQMSDEEKVAFVDAAIKTVAGLAAKHMLENPEASLETLEVIQARRETDEWAGHRTAEGIA